MKSVVFGLQPGQLSHTLQLEEHYDISATRIGAPHKEQSCAWPTDLAQLLGIPGC